MIVMKEFSFEEKVSLLWYSEQMVFSFLILDCDVLNEAVDLAIF